MRSTYLSSFLKLNEKDFENLVPTSLVSPFMRSEVLMKAFSLLFKVTCALLWETWQPIMCGFASIRHPIIGWTNKGFTHLRERLEKERKRRYEFPLIYLLQYDDNRSFFVCCFRETQPVSSKGSRLHQEELMLMCVRTALMRLRKSLQFCSSQVAPFIFIFIWKAKPLFGQTTNQSDDSTTLSSIQTGTQMAFVKTTRAQWLPRLNARPKMPAEQK